MELRLLRRKNKLAKERQSKRRDAWKRNIHGIGKHTHTRSWLGFKFISSFILILIKNKLDDKSI